MPTNKLTSHRRHIRKLRADHTGLVTLTRLDNTGPQLSYWPTGAISICMHIDHKNETLRLRLSDARYRRMAACHDSMFDKCMQVLAKHAARRQPYASSGLRITWVNWPAAAIAAREPVVNSRNDQTLSTPGAFAHFSPQAFDLQWSISGKRWKRRSEKLSWGIHCLFSLLGWWIFSSRKQAILTRETYVL